jgi:hypothetical protein
MFANKGAEHDLQRAILHFVQNALFFSCVLLFGNQLRQQTFFLAG